MAVKHKVVEYDERIPTTPGEYVHLLLRALEQYRDEPGKIPQGNELDKLCEAIAKTLSVLAIPTDPPALTKFTQDLQAIQEVLDFICNLEEHRESLVYVVLKKLYNIISVPEGTPSGAMCILLNLIDPIKLEQVIKCILEEEQDERSLESALRKLCTWMNFSVKSANLGECILIFIRGLEIQKRYDILRNVTVDMVEKMFKCMLLPSYRITTVPVVNYMLSHMLDDPSAFHKVVPHVPPLIEHLKLAGENSFAEDIVNLCKALTEHFRGYDTMYAILDKVFVLYPPVNYQIYLSPTPWTRATSGTLYRHRDMDKVGLENLGNTCFMNSVLQALFMTKSFSNSILKLSTTHQAMMMSKLQALFAMMQYSNEMWLSPKDMLNAQPSKFTNGIQHDSSEFLAHLLETLHEECKTEAEKLRAINGGAVNDYPIAMLVQDSFGGRAETVYRCLVCGTESKRADNFRELQLSFPSDFCEGDTVQSLLEYYFKPERLCGDNQYYCEQCNGLTDAERGFHVLESPPRLVLTLKHFQYDPNFQTHRKLLHRVQYNDEIHLQDIRYELYAAVIHSGCHVDSGHYYTYAKDSTAWYKFNDTWVNSTCAADFHELQLPATPYILFYRRKDCVDLAPLPRNQLPLFLENMLRRELASLAAERRAQQQRSDTTVQHVIKRDDPPPPGCGGGFQLSTTGYVC